MIFVWTFSKVLVPGLSDGLLLAEQPVIDRLLDCKRAPELAFSSPSLRALSSYIALGHYQAHLRCTIAVHLQRPDALVGVIERHLPPAVRLSLTGLAGRELHRAVGCRILHMLAYLTVDGGRKWIDGGGARAYLWSRRSVAISCRRFRHPAGDSLGRSRLFVMPDGETVRRASAKYGTAADVFHAAVTIAELAGRPTRPARGEVGGNAT